MTAGHCSPNWGFVDNSWITQPWLNTPLSIGYEIHDDSWACAGGRCDHAELGLYNTNFIDFDSGLGELPYELGLVWRLETRVSGPTGIGSPYVNQTFPRLTVTGIQSYTVMSQLVDKVGRNSGWTFGSTYQTCVTFQMTPTYKVHCSDYVSFTSIGGDSGGPVFIHYPNIPPNEGGNGISFLGINVASHQTTSGVQIGGVISNSTQIRNEIGFFRFW